MIFSMLTALLAIGLAVAFFFMQNKTATILFFAIALVFIAVFFRNLRRANRYVNGNNLLPLKKTLVDQSEKTRSFKEILRNNLLGNHYKLESGYYVNTKNKKYDIYFSTYTNRDIKEKLTKLCTRFGKDADYILGAVGRCGYTQSPVNITDLSHHIVSSARYYDKADLFTHQRRKYFIFVGVDNSNPPPKPMFTFWVLPYNDAQSVDQLTFVDIFSAQGVARLDTMPFHRNPELCKEIRKIFKGIIDFDGEVSAERVRELNKHD